MEIIVYITGVGAMLEYLVNDKGFSRFALCL